jgi:Tfp pilus assembly protein PilV
MNLSFPRLPGVQAFSLVEVVLALGICAFVLIAMLGLLSTGLQSSKDSEDQIQAANVASLLISTCLANPTNSPANFAIPSSALTNGYANAYPGGINFIGVDGNLTNVSNAAYVITCQAGTNTISGSSLAQVYLMLTWPARATPSNVTVRRYEISTYIPLNPLQ